MENEYEIPIRVENIRQEEKEIFEKLPVESRSANKFLSNEKSLSESELDFSSGCLISNINTRKKENSNLVKNILNHSKTKTKYTKRKSFFRTLTNTKCNLLKDEQKILNEKILMFYKNAEFKIKEHDEVSLISFNSKFEKESRLNQSNSEVLSKNCSNFHKNFSKLNDSETNFKHFQKSLSKSGNEFSFYQKNKLQHMDKKPRKFNILIVGAQNVGKTSFIKYFEKRMNHMTEEENIIERVNEENSSLSNFSKKISHRFVFKPTKKFKPHRIKFNSNNYNISTDSEINFIDSPGFTPFNQNEWIGSILKYINNLFQRYSDQKEIVNKQEDLCSILDDCRIHLCLYFIDILNDLDFKFMKDIGDITNLVPIISRKDLSDKDDIIRMKIKIMDEGKKKNINFMKFDEKNYLENENLKQFLFEGIYGECPPFVISLWLKSLNVKIGQDHPAYFFNISELSDTNRLYYLLACIMFILIYLLAFVSFESLEKTKNFYKKFKQKNNLQLVKLEEMKKKKNNFNTKTLYGLLMFIAPHIYSYKFITKTGQMKF